MFIQHIQFPYVNVDALRDGAVGVPLLIKSPVHHVNPLTEANAIDLSLVALPSYFYMQRLAIDNPSSRCGSTTIVKLDSIQRCGGPVSLYAGCLYNVEQLRPLLFSSKMKERKKKGVFFFNFLFFLSTKEQIGQLARTGSLALDCLGKSCVWPTVRLGSAVLCGM